MIRTNLLPTAKTSRRIAALATVSSMAICLLLPEIAIAQEVEEEAPTDDSNVIIVTGFRASLDVAQDIKREADTIVDVVSAEDIGALADRSVAEALQRIPGVNISRFEKSSDPDRFSVEGTGVIIRGLPYVRSELNGRDIFSATGGRELSFNDVSPELLGRIEVFKNNTADMIDGGISGTVNLVTRKPLDNPGLKLAGTAEVNYGDLAKEWSPGFSVLGSDTFETGIGTFGIQLGYAQQELVTRTDASQIADPCYRAASLDAPCIRAQTVVDGGFIDAPAYDASNFPPPGSVIVPKGGGVRTTDLNRDRKAYSGVLQWASNDDRARVSLEYLRAKTKSRLDEAALLAQVNDDGLFPLQAAGGEFTFDENGLFQTGTLTQNSPFNPAGGIPTEALRFQRAERAKTEDFSIDIDLEPTDRLRFNFEGQYIRSDREMDAIIADMETFADIRIDNTGSTPSIEFLKPGGGSSDTYFTDPAQSYYWFLLDSKIKNDGDMTSMRMDAEYDISDTGFFKRAKFGARWADRHRVTRDTDFGNWGNLSAPWTGRNGNWNGDDPQAFGGGAYVTDFPDYANARSPFGDNFQRGNTAVPVSGGSALFFGGDDLLDEYLSGTTQGQANEITAFSLTPNAWRPIYDRSAQLLDGTIVQCDTFCPSEISDVKESTRAFYGRLDFGSDFGNGMRLDGNIGLRYVDTSIRSGGQLGFPSPLALGFDADTVVTADMLRTTCDNAVEGTPGLEYCDLSDARLAEFANAYTGEILDDSNTIDFEHWLPSLNLRLDLRNGFVLRGAVSKGISRPDLAAFRTGGTIGNNTAALLAGGTLETGPLFAIKTGNRFLQPIESWNYDLSAEWYFDNVGSLTAAFFMKDITKIINNSTSTRTVTSPSGVVQDVEVRGPFNTEGGTLKGIELAYQQSFDFLPGVLSGLGAQLTYTYVDAGDFSNTGVDNRGPFLDGLPLVGVSENTVNAVLFYEKGPVSARAAYNWRSSYLITPRDDIFPYSPIMGESTGQLDASLFFAVTDNLKLGVQGVNLLDEVTRTSQVIDFDGTRVRRSAFRNDRRYTFLARFDF